MNRSESICPTQNIKKIIESGAYIQKLANYTIDNLSDESIRYLDKNENPFETPISDFSTSEILQDLRRYPDPYCNTLLNSISKVIDIPSCYLLSGNGSDELIDMIIRAYSEENDTILSVSPSFTMYKIYAQINRTSFISVPLKLKLIHSKRIAIYDLDEEEFLRIAKLAKIIILARPNNPDGNVLRLSFIEELLKLNKLTIIDEAYIEFSNEPSLVSLVKKNENLIVLRTFSKAYGLAGLRLGYGVMNPSIKDVLIQIKSPFNVNRLASKFGIKILKSQKAVIENIEKIKIIRDEFFKNLIQNQDINQNYLVHPSEGIFVLIRFMNTEIAKSIYEYLLKNKIKVRKYEETELSSCLRISIGLQSDMNEVLYKLNSFFKVI